MEKVVRKTDRIYTYADYKNWPDDERWELIDGEAWCMSPAPSRTHQELSMILCLEIGNFIKNKPYSIFAAPFDVFFIEKPNWTEHEIKNIVQPDVVVVCDESKLEERGCMGAPNIVVEILSPYTSKKDLDNKFHLYERNGVAEYWVVHPDGKCVQIFRPGEDGNYDAGELIEHGGIITSSVLKDFRIEATVLFGPYEKSPLDDIDETKVRRL